MIPLTQNDDLTGLLTRKSFREVFSQHLAQSRAQDHEQPLSLGFFDIDSFLKINETYGHLAGDYLLTGIAEELQKLAGANDVVCRYGGDEFAVLLVGKEREQAFLALEQLRSTVSARQFTTQSGQHIQGVTISAGLAAFPVDGRTEAELLRKADQALYRAKSAGRNQVRLAYEERMLPKTAHFTQTQLERLSKLSDAHSVNEADLLREAVDDLLTKYGINDIES
jgi:diguanylate cyclase (GGDEF)-like protein